MATLRGIAFEARGVVLDWTSSDTRAPRKGFSSPPHPSPRRPEVFFPASVASGQNHPRVRSTASVAFGRVANRADHAQRLSAPVSADSFRDCRDSSSVTSTTRATSHAPPCPPPPPLSPGARPSVARPSRPPSGAPRAPSRSPSPRPTRARAAPSWFAPTRSASTWGWSGRRARPSARPAVSETSWVPSPRCAIRAFDRDTEPRPPVPSTRSLRDPSDPRPLPWRDRASSAAHLVYSPDAARRRDPRSSARPFTYPARPINSENTSIDPEPARGALSSLPLAPGSGSPRPPRDDGGAHVPPLRRVRHALRPHHPQRVRHRHGGALLPRAPRRRRPRVRLASVLLRRGRPDLQRVHHGRRVAWRFALAGWHRGGVARALRGFPLRRRIAAVRRQRLAHRTFARLPSRVLPGSLQARIRAVHPRGAQHRAPGPKPL